MWPEVSPNRIKYYLGQDLYLHIFEKECKRCLMWLQDLLRNNNDLPEVIASEEKIGAYVQTNKYLFHKKYFNLKANSFLSLWDNFYYNIFSSYLHNLECSCKIERQKIYPYRFNISFYDRSKYLYLWKEISGFLDNIKSRKNIKINPHLLRQVFNINCDLQHTVKIILGIDYRRKLKDSRIKLYFKIVDLPKKLPQLLKICNYDGKLDDLIINDKFLFGIDFYFDGRTKLKVYLIYLKKDLERLKINNISKGYFHQRIIDLISECQMMHLSINNKNKQKIIHFHFRDANYFKRLISIETFAKTAEELQLNKFGSRIISIPEKDILKGVINNFNLYYS